MAGEDGSPRTLGSRCMSPTSRDLGTLFIVIVIVKDNDQSPSYFAEIGMVETVFSVQSRQIINKAISGSLGAHLGTHYFTYSFFFVV